MRGGYPNILSLSKGVHTYLEPVDERDEVGEMLLDSQKEKTEDFHSFIDESGSVFQPNSPQKQELIPWEKLKSDTDKILKLASHRNSGSSNDGPISQRKVTSEIEGLPESIEAVFNTVFDFAKCVGESSSNPRKDKDGSKSIDCEIVADNVVSQVKEVGEEDAENLNLGAMVVAASGPSMEIPVAGGVPKMESHRSNGSLEIVASVGFSKQICSAPISHDAVACANKEGINVDCMGCVDNHKMAGFKEILNINNLNSKSEVGKSKVSLLKNQNNGPSVNEQLALCDVSSIKGIEKASHIYSNVGGTQGNLYVLNDKNKKNGSSKFSFGPVGSGRLKRAGGNIGLEGNVKRIGLCADRVGSLVGNSIEQSYVDGKSKGPGVGPIIIDGKFGPVDLSIFNKADGDKTGAKTVSCDVGGLSFGVGMDKPSSAFQFDKGAGPNSKWRGPASMINKGQKAPFIFGQHGNYFNSNKMPSPLIIGSNVSSKPIEKVSGSSSEPHAHKSNEEQNQAKGSDGERILKGVPDWKKLFPSSSGGNYENDKGIAGAFSSLPEYDTSEFRAQERLIMPDSVTKMGKSHWENCLVGYFLSGNLSFKAIHAIASKHWKDRGLSRIFARKNFILFKFNNPEACSLVLESGPWNFAGKPIVLQKWVPHRNYNLLSAEKIPIWVKLHDFPIEFWTKEGLGWAGSMIGKPLSVDRFTESKARIDFARILVEVNAKDPILRSFLVQGSDGDATRVWVEYPGIPIICKFCKSFGHYCSRNKQKSFREEDEVSEDEIEDQSDENSEYSDHIESKEEVDTSHMPGKVGSGEENRNFHIKPISPGRYKNQEFPSQEWKAVKKSSQRSLDKNDGSSAPAPSGKENGVIPVKSSNKFEILSEIHEEENDATRNLEGVVSGTVKDGSLNDNKVVMNDKANVEPPEPSMNVSADGKSIEDKSLINVPVSEIMDVNVSKNVNVIDGSTIGKSSSKSNLKDLVSDQSLSDSGNMELNDDSSELDIIRIEQFVGSKMEGVNKFPSDPVSNENGCKVMENKKVDVSDYGSMDTNEGCTDLNLQGLEQLMGSEQVGINSIPPEHVLKGNRCKELAAIKAVDSEMGRKELVNQKPNTQIKVKGNSGSVFESGKQDVLEDPGESSMYSEQASKKKKKKQVKIEFNEIRSPASKNGKAIKSGSRNISCSISGHLKPDKPKNL